MPVNRAKTDETAKHFGLPVNLLRTGALDGKFVGCFFVIGKRGDRVWDWELLEARLKELCQVCDQHQVPEQVGYGKLRRIN